MRWQQKLYSTDLKERIGQEVTLKGWVHFTRKSGKIRFLGLRDGAAIIQCILIRGETKDESFESFKQCTQETGVAITGKVQPNDRSSLGVEILVTHIEILSGSKNYPITPKEHGTDFLLSHRHLWLRSNKQRALFQIRNQVFFSLHQFMFQHRFVRMDSPILTTSVGEDPSGLFSVDYFDLGKAYLAQTGQLYLEAAIFAHAKVYCLGPTFRAEKSKTRRHLTEFWMLEAEMAFFDNQDNMDFQEDLLHQVIADVLENCAEQLKILERDTNFLEGCLQPFVRLDYSEAIEHLKQKGRDVQWGQDLGAPDEALLTEDQTSCMFVTNYPKDAKAFYMKEDPTNPRAVLCVDLLAPEGYGEISGGSQREDDVDKLLARIEAQGLPIQNYQWYLDLRRYGSVTHSGFGLGIERLVGWLAGIKHIREAIPFPRMMERLTP